MEHFGENRLRSRGTRGLCASCRRRPARPSRDRKEILGAILIPVLLGDREGSGPSRFLMEAELTGTSRKAPAGPWGWSSPARLGRKEAEGEDSASRVPEGVAEVEGLSETRAAGDTGESWTSASLDFPSRETLRQRLTDAPEARNLHQQLDSGPTLDLWRLGSLQCPVGTTRDCEGETRCYTPRLQVSVDDRCWRDNDDDGVLTANGATQRPPAARPPSAPPSPPSARPLENRSNTELLLGSLIGLCAAPLPDLPVLKGETSHHSPAPRSHWGPLKGTVMLHPSPHQRPQTPEEKGAWGCQGAAASLRGSGLVSLDSWQEEVAGLPPSLVPAQKLRGHGWDSHG